jgi:myo-inositol 2-dehydrogenase/D-chiro-inositol 1-dehydrogenase
VTVKAGILGAGFIGRIHALNLRRDSRVSLVGIADVVPAAAERLAAEVETAALGSLADLLDRGAHAVYVCTPNVQHVEPVTTALAAGVHVFSEKPMATTLRGAWEIREAARTARGIYQLGLNRRFARVYKFVKGLIEDGRLHPLLAQMKHNRGELRQPPWTGDPLVTGGYLYETPVHLFDMGRFLFGDVEEVSGAARQSVYDELDGFALLFRYRSGVVASVTSVAHTSWFFPYERVEVYGSHQTAVTEELERVWYSPGMRDQAEGIDCFQMPFEEKWGYVEEDRRFIDAVLGEGPSAVTAEDGYRATELVEAVYTAVRSGNAVRLPLAVPA